ncbi:MAG: hypothetical protein ACRDIY_02125 [Chloroflexota bacterium]
MAATLTDEQVRDVMNESWIALWGAPNREARRRERGKGGETR